MPVRVLVCLLLGGILAAGCASAAGYYTQGLKQNIAGRYETAAEKFTAAIKLNPTAAEYYYNRAIAFYLSQNINSAKEDLKQALLQKTERQDRLAIKILLAQMVIHLQEDNFPAARAAIKSMRDFGLSEEARLKLTAQVENLAAPN